MHKQLSANRICRAAAIMLAIATSVAGYANPPASPRDIADFFRETIGEWVGTVDQYTGGKKTDTKYFHAVATQTSPETYEAVFEYYRLDTKTYAPVQVGVTSMTIKITTEGTASTTMTGKGDVSLDPTTAKPEEHQLSQVLRMAPSGRLEGKGSGKISVGGTTLDAGKNGKISNYTSTWTLDNDGLRISERLRASFRLLFITKHYDIADDFKARRGSDITGLMMSAGDNSTSDTAKAIPNH